MTPVYLHKSGAKIYIDGKDKADVLKNLREVLKSWGFKYKDVKEIEEKGDNNNEM